MNKNIGWFIALILVAFSTWFVTKKYYTQPLPVVDPVVAKPVVSTPIKIDKDITYEQAVGELNKFYTFTPEIKWYLLEQTRTNVDIMIEGKLYIRTFTQEASIPLVQVGSSGNWKLYTGFGLGALATTGAIYAGYKLWKELH